MDDYILDRIRCDADHVINLAEQQKAIQHSGLKGRFRELLIDNVLAPWLPPYVVCGTGMIIAENNIKRQSTQDDIILYDKSICPPVLASNNAPEGVFLYNSVIARIEVKSTLTRDDIRKFIKSSLEISKLEFSVRPECPPGLQGAFNLLFAFNTDAQGEANPDYHLKRLIEEMVASKQDPVGGIVSMLCIPGKGFWKIGINNNKRIWQRLGSDDPRDHLAWFVGCISNSCFEQHALRQGRMPSTGIEAGIGMYLAHPFLQVDINEKK